MIARLVTATFPDVLKIAVLGFLEFSKTRGEIVVLGITPFNQHSVAVVRQVTSVLRNFV
jgi:hypothetical protein